QNKWGYRILDNVIRGKFQGKIFPINHKEKEICGLEAYPSIKDVPDSVDLAIIVVPGKLVPRVLEECLEKRVKAGVMITAGFGEVGAEGKYLEKDLAGIAREGGMVFSGPNCNGLISTACDLSAAMGSIFPPKGTISMVTQSGNIGTLILSRGVKNSVGFSKYVSSGNEACLRSEDFIEFFGEDPETELIISYIEGIKDGRRFFEVCKKVSLNKPILLFKAGGTDGGARAVHSHTGSIAGAGDIFDAACAQTGVLKCDNLDELFDVATTLLRQPLPKSRRVGIVTSGGGWGALASDSCERKGLKVAPISKKSIEALDKILPPWWSKGNPIDLVAGTHQDRDKIFETCIKTLIENNETDSILILGLGLMLELMEKKKKDRTLSEIEERMMAAEMRLADVILRSLDEYGCPIITATDPNSFDKPEENPLFKKLREHQILSFSDTDRAAAVLWAMYKRYRYLEKWGTTTT
ncbi:acetate--CoA ligase family protein, partial [Thermodesulfobacteriota bacterium]